MSRVLKRTCIYQGKASVVTLLLTQYHLYTYCDGELSFPLQVQEPAEYEISAL